MSILVSSNNNEVYYFAKKVWELGASPHISQSIFLITLINICTWKMWRTRQVGDSEILQSINRLEVELLP